MTVEFSVGKDRLRQLIAEFSPLSGSSNEAQTRFSYIDRLVNDVLGWEHEDIKVEVYEEGNRTDYECGNPRQLIIEAKKASSSLPLPPNRGAAFRFKISSLTEYAPETKSAIEQVQRYCQERGVQFAAVSNGPQLVVFLATRLDGKRPLDFDALVFNGYEQQQAGFNLIFDSLSPGGVKERRLAEHLGLTPVSGLPQKLSNVCHGYFDYKYSSQFQEHIRNASSLIVEDLGRTPELEQSFLEECYCESGPITQYSLLGRDLLHARYAALFPSKESASQIQPVNPRKPETPISSQLFAEAIARRPIVLVGDVGVGKTSFIKHLTKVRAKAELGNGLFVYLDLGSKGILSKSSKDALLDELEMTLRRGYKVNLQDQSLLEVVYKNELDDFDRGIVGKLKESQPTVFEAKRIEFVLSLIQNRDSHLRRCLQEICRARKLQLIIVLDNADQRSLGVQQDAFLIAQELTANWGAMVFLSLRPQTFHASKRSGAISAYPPKVFVVPPPKVEDVIERRLVFALGVTEGRLPVPQIEGLRLHIQSLAILIKVIRDSLKENPALLEFIANVSAGNIRVAIELISKFIGNPNIESEKIVRIIEGGDSYIIPLHEFAKAGLLAEYSHFQEESSFASNVYAIYYPDPREHFLSLAILGFLSWGGAPRTQAEGFVSSDQIVREMQNQGFTPEQITTHIQRLTRKNLLESTARRTLETEEELRNEGLPEAFRATSLGVYHLKRWAVDFEFLESMAFDTPILDKGVREGISAVVNDNRLFARYVRAKRFRNYLDSCWGQLKSRPYFDWTLTRESGAKAFSKVERYLSDRGHNIASA